MQRFAKALVAAASLWGMSALPAFSAYLVNADNFSLIASGPNINGGLTPLEFNDTFYSSLPPSGPLGGATYATTNGTFTGGNGVATMNESNGSSTIFDGRQYIHHNAILPIHVGGGSTDESFTGAKQDRPTLLLRSLRVDKAHFGPLGRDHDRLGVRCIVLLAFHERLHVLRSNQLHLMTEPGHLSGPVMGAAAGLHNHQRWRLFGHESGETLPRQLLAKLGLARHRRSV